MLFRSVVAGSAAGLLALYINYNSQNVYVVTHPLEQMLAFASPSIHAGDNGTVHFLIRAVWGVFERRTFVLESSPRPTIFLEWLTIAMIVFAWRKGHRHAALQASAMLAVVWGVDTLGMARGLKQEYFILTDPLVIVAAALLVAGIKELQWHTWTYRIGTAIVAAHIVVSQAEPVKHIFRTDGPEVLCGLYHNAQKVERLPVCQKQ